MIIKSKAGITNAEAFKILSDKMKKGELTPEQQQTYEFLKDNTKIKEAEAKKMEEELIALGLKEAQAINIVNILPTDETTLKLILKEEKELKKDDLKKILDVVGK